MIVRSFVRAMSVTGYVNNLPPFFLRQSQEGLGGKLTPANAALYGDTMLLLPLSLLAVLLLVLDVMTSLIPRYLSNLCF